MTIENGKSPGSSPRGSANTIDSAKLTESDNAGRGADVNRVVATAYGPAPGRKMWAYAVACPSGHAHLHRGGPPRAEGHRRTAPCGAEYLIFVRTVLPAQGSAA